MSLGKYCHACQAIPAAGYCNLANCPTANFEDLKLADREYFAMGKDVFCASEGGALIVADAIDSDMATIISRRLGLRLDLAMGALRVAVKAPDLVAAQAFAQTAMDFLTGDCEPREGEDGHE